MLQLHLLVHCGAFKDPTDTCILHIFGNFENMQTTDTQATTSKIHYIIIFWSQTQVLQSLRHFITDYMTDVKSTKALMPWNKSLGKWVSFHITVRGGTAGHIHTCANGAKFWPIYMNLYNTVNIICIIQFAPRGIKVTTILSCALLQQPCFYSITKGSHHHHSKIATRLFHSLKFKHCVSAIEESKI